MPLRTLFFVVVFLLTMRVGQAQSVRGKILVPSVRASERIEVRLEKPEGPLAERTFSDSLGNFDFSVPPGRYILVVNLEGYKEERINVDVGAGPAGGAVVNVPLEEKDTVQIVELSSGDPVIDVAELNRNYPAEAIRQYEEALKDARDEDFATAIQRLESAIGLAPDFYSAHNVLGEIYLKMTRYRDAERQFIQARDLSPRSVQPLIHLGSLYIQEAQSGAGGQPYAIGRILDDALDSLEKALALDPRSALVHYLLGLANYQSQFLEEAESHLKRALAIDEEMGAARLMLANVYARDARWQNALNELDVYLKEHSDAPNRAEVEQTRIKLRENIQKGQ